MMNVKKKIFLVGAILMLGFFGVFNLAQAAFPFCCMGDCSNVQLEIGDPPPAGCVNLQADTCAANNCTGASVTPPASETSATVTFPNPLAIDTIEGLLQSILDNLKGLLIIIAVIFIIIGGIMYMTSAGNEKMATMGKKTVTYAIVGLIIALAAPAFLRTILDILEVNSIPDPNGEVTNALTLNEIAVNILEFLLSVFGILAIISLLIGGGMYLTSGGNDKKIELGKKMITYAIIGILVGLSALVIVRQIDSWISGM